MSTSFNNYTVTDVTINNLSEGDNLSSLYNSASITLSPNMGYYLDAEWFYLASPADYIWYAEFTQSGENVICTLYFQTEFIMPDFNVDIPLCIGGAAELKQFTVYGYVSYSVSNWYYSTYYDAFPVTGNYNSSVTAWSSTIRADSGYYFATPPTITQTVGDSDIFTINYYDTFDIEGRLISREITIYCTIPNYNSAGNTFSVNAIASEIFVPVEEITGYLIDSSAIPEFGALRTLTIFGSADTPWVLNCADPILQTGPADPITGLIPYGTSVSGTISSTGSSSLLINIGAVTVNTVYSIGLVADLSVGFSQPLPIILNQYANTTITYTTSPGTLFVNSGDKYNTGAAYSNPLPGMDGYNNVFNWDIFTNYSVNDYNIILISQPLPSDFDNLDPAFNGGSSIGINSITAEQPLPGFIEMQITGAVGTYGIADMITVLDLSESIAYINTFEATSITSTTAESGGEVLIDGTRGTFGMKGICYSTSAIPTVDDSIIPDATGFGSFTSAMSGLTPSTTYYVRSYGYNSDGVLFYGPERTFATLAGTMDLNLFQTCSGPNVTYVGASAITGGVAPYYKANTYFTSEGAALANTSWSSTPNSGSVAFDYAVPGFGTYWIAVKDSDDTVFAKGFYADCWDSVAAVRNSAYLSANAYSSSIGACGSGSTQNVYIAYRNPGTLAIGDRIFVASSGSTPFNGTIVSEVQNWWNFNDAGIYAACPSGTTIRIDDDGWITDFACCP